MLLKERPGLQNITYTAIFDYLGRQRLVPSMCERALQQKDANVNILLDFVTDLTFLTPLFLGHKPTSVMTDSRSPEQFDKIKANKDSLTFSLNIYKTTPML